MPARPVDGLGHALRVLLTIVLLPLASCAGDRGPPTTNFRFIVQADESINPNSSGEPSPVVLKIYELKSSTGFMQADFFKLLDDDAAALGADLVSKREVEIKPGENLGFDRASPYDTKYIGVIAGFRTINNATWRAGVDSKPGQGGLYVISVTAASVEISFVKDKVLGLF